MTSNQLDALQAANHKLDALLLAPEIQAALENVANLEAQCDHTYTDQTTAVKNVGRGRKCMICKETDFSRTDPILAESYRGYDIIAKQGMFWVVLKGHERDYLAVQDAKEAIDLHLDY